MANKHTNQDSVDLTGSLTPDSGQNQHQGQTAEVYPDNGNGAEAEAEGVA